MTVPTNMRLFGDFIRGSEKFFFFWICLALAICILMVKIFLCILYLLSPYAICIVYSSFYSLVSLYNFIDNTTPVITALLIGLLKISLCVIFLVVHLLWTILHRLYKVNIFEVAFAIPTSLVFHCQGEIK